MLRDGTICPTGTLRGNTPRGHPEGTSRSRRAVRRDTSPSFCRCRNRSGRTAVPPGTGCRGASAERRQARNTPAVPPPRAPALRSPTNTFTVHRAGEKSCVPAPSGRFSRGIKGEGKVRPPESGHAVPSGTFGGRSPGPCLFLKPTRPLTATSPPSLIFRSRYFCENCGDVSAAAFAPAVPSAPCAAAATQRPRAVRDCAAPRVGFS